MPLSCFLDLAGPVLSIRLGLIPCANTCDNSPELATSKLKPSLSRV